MDNLLNINNEIERAETLPSFFYQDAALFEKSKAKIFEKCWHFIGDDAALRSSFSLLPYQLLEGFLDEPILFSRDEHYELHCLSNVCTHRGNLLYQHPCSAKKILCNYHGRRFGLNGQFEYMPEFKEAKDFPRQCEHLPKVPFYQWHRFLFASIFPSFSIEEVLQKISQRLYWFPFDNLRFDANRSKDYLVNAHWALYCDNYLEGLHIPFVHPSLNQALDYGTYKTELDEFFNLQIGYASGGTDVFAIPEGAQDHGKEVAAFYYWIFPNLMLNFYPWGISVNVVKPIHGNLTKVSFLSFVADETKLDLGAGAALDKVEREDEAVVEAVAKGIRSRFYKTGRFSPSKEACVHHFHGLLARFMNA